MSWIRFVSWGVLTLFIMGLVSGGVHSLTELWSGLLGLSPNTATAGGYTMEVVCSSIAFVCVLWRLLWAVEGSRTVEDVFALLKNRAALLSLAIAALIAMTFSNRVFWWGRHMFTQRAFDYDHYSGAANAVIVSLIMCVFVYTVSGRHNVDKDEEDLKFGLRFAVPMFFVGCVAYVIGVFLYLSQAGLNHG